MGRSRYVPDNFGSGWSKDVYKRQGFDMTAATTGINETNAKKSGLEVDTVILSPMSLSLIHI